MRLLLDTHVLLWWLADDPRLPSRVRGRVEGAAQVLVSAMTVWEIEIKRALGRLDAPDDLVELLPSQGMGLLPLTAVHAVAAARLPRHHEDPFDRALVACAQVDGLRLVTADATVLAYDVAALDAR